MSRAATPRAAALLGMTAALLGACRGDRGAPAPEPAVEAPPPPFTEVAAASGIDFVHHSGATEDFLPNDGVASAR